MEAYENQTQNFEKQQTQLTPEALAEAFYSLSDEDKATFLSIISKDDNADTTNTSPQEIQSTPEIDVTPDKLRTIISSITSKAMYGKFGNRPTGYEIRGNKDIDPYGDFRKIYALFGEGRHRQEGIFVGSNVFAYALDPTNPAMSRFSIVYGHRGTDHVGRSTLNMAVQFKLPTSQLEELTDTIREDPDKLEDFYAIAAAHGKKASEDKESIYYKDRVRVPKLLMVDMNNPALEETLSRYRFGSPPDDINPTTTPGIEELTVTR